MNQQAYKTWVLGLLVFGLAFHVHAESLRVEQYLDDMPDLFESTQSWGVLGVNTASYDPSGAPPLPLQILDRTYDRGIGHHAVGEIRIPLEERYLAFKAEVGVQWQGGDLGSVVFEVWVDDEMRFAGGPMNDSDPAVPVAIPLDGARLLRLVAHDGGGGITCSMANWAEARLVHDGRMPFTGRPVYSFNETPWPEPAWMEGSYGLIGHDSASQMAFSRPLGLGTLIADGNESVQIALPIQDIHIPFSVEADVRHAGGGAATITLALASGDSIGQTLSNRHGTTMAVSGGTTDTDRVLLTVAADSDATAVRLLRLRLSVDGQTRTLNILPARTAPSEFPQPLDITAHPLLEGELIEWDWRMQDGIEAGAVSGAFAATIETTLARGDALLKDLAQQDAVPTGFKEAWAALHSQYAELSTQDTALDDSEWEELWREVHIQRRALMLSHPLAQTGPLVFAKQAPGVFSHQLTQYYGRYARPGGGVYVLEAPGASMQTRPLANDALPEGSFMQPEVTHDGQRILVAFCETDNAPADTIQGEQGRYYHLYEMAADGSYARRLTDGPYDDFSPVELPNGRIMFISTRRGGWHRCGSPGCETYTLTLMEPDGSDIRTVSFHETQEWDPAVLNDGRVIYTRWDYVDRDAVHYQQLWAVRPDGTGPAAYYGNHTLNPAGVWEARPVPNSTAVMATAGAHHAMTAGSIILVDQTRGVDGLEPITRLTTHVPFPETEDVLLPHWRSAIAFDPPPTSPEMERWPGQSYRSPYPLSENVFIAAYSFDPLIGEPNANPANTYGLYLADAHGNKELLYRDLNISSVWPMPLRSRTSAPALPSILAEDAPNEGVFYLQDVYQSTAPLPRGEITHLRIVQVLPKSTPHANNPTLGAPNASPGKQVLGTVPVEADGSAYFHAPAGIGLAFQALDETGQAVHMMRSIAYLQPGEHASCIGCHEPRHDAPPALLGNAMALERPPSVIEPGPDGSLPFSYPLLVQPVLDAHCIQCHGHERAEGLAGQPPLLLTGEPEGRYTVSYNALVDRVSYAAWGRGPFPEGNSEPTTQPGFFGAKGSRLMVLLTKKHGDVELSPDDLDRLITWMDANALFYGTFNYEDQARQQRGERIEGPDLE